MQFHRDLLTYVPPWKVSKYEVFFGPNTGKYGPEKTPYLDIVHAVKCFIVYNINKKNKNKKIANKKKHWL